MPNSLELTELLLLKELLVKVLTTLLVLELVFKVVPALELELVLPPVNRHTLLDLLVLNVRYVSKLNKHFSIILCWSRNIRFR